MNCSEYYMTLPKDLSGSISKNRFRNEILWGLSKIYDIYDKNDDFFVVFDYVCDIEVHTDKSLELYQVKTNKSLTPYTCASLTKLKKGKSILGKLFLVKTKVPIIAMPNIKIGIVSNVFFEKYKTKEILDFTTCEEDLKKKIVKCLEEELRITPIILDNSYYIYTPMNLLSPTDDLFGKTYRFFCKVKGCEPIKPNVLFNILKDKVTEKACYELEVQDFDDLIFKKGFTKKEINEILDKHITNSDDIIIKSKEFIKNNYSNFIERTKMNNSLALVIVTKDELIDNIKNEITIFIGSNEDLFNINDKEVVEVLFKQFKDNFSIEYNDYDIRAVIIITILKYEEAVYEK